MITGIRPYARYQAAHEQPLGVVRVLPVTTQNLGTSLGKQCRVLGTRVGVSHTASAQAEELYARIVYMDDPNRIRSLWSR